MGGALVPGWVIDAETGTQSALHYNHDRSNTDWDDIGQCKEIRAVYNHAKLKRTLTDLLVTNKNQSKLSRLPHATWIRAKGHAEMTHEHVDYYHFYDKTTVIGDHLRQSSHRVASVTNDNSITCCICAKSFERRQLNAAPRAYKQFHCQQCINLPVSIYTVWMPLTNINADADGRLAIVPRSHKFNGYECRRGQQNELPGDFTSAIHSSSIWHMPSQLKQGDIIIFNLKTVHAATVNASGKYRLSMDTRILVPPQLKRLRKQVGSIVAPSNQPQSNLPPSMNCDEAASIASRSNRMIMMKNASDGLKFNCDQLGLEVRKSLIPNSGRGLFTLEDYTPSSLSASSATRLIAYMFGIIRTRDRHNELIQNPHLAEGYEVDFVADYADGICNVYELVDWLSDSKHEYVIMISRQCPMVIMNDPINQRSKVKHGSEVTIASMPNNIIERTIESQRNMDYMTFPFHVPNVALAAGSEVYINYNWSDTFWRSIRKKMNAQQPAEPRKKIFNRQLKNVKDFLNLPTSKVIMSGFRYNATAGEPTQQDVEDCSHVALRVSTAIPSIMGVIIMKPFVNEM